MSSYVIVELESGFAPDGPATVIGYASEPENAVLYEPRIRLWPNTEPTLHLGQRVKRISVPL